MLDLEAGTPKFYRAPDCHVIAEAGRLQESRPRAHEWETVEFKILEHAEFGHAERTLEQQRCRRIEYFEVARVKDDAGGITVSPLDPHCAGTAKRGHSVTFQRGAMRSAPSSRITSPLR